MSTLLGIHMGRRSLRASLLSKHGTLIDRQEKWFRHPRDLAPSLLETLVELSSTPSWATLEVLAIGLDKAQRPLLPHDEIVPILPPQANLLTFPSQLATLLGAIPEGPGLLVSLGSELRIAAIDSTHKCHDFRFQEGGGQWWVAELRRLAQHSQRLQQALSRYQSLDATLRAIPKLLETADFPSPDPVLKIRVDGLCETIATSCLRLASRLSGVRHVTFSGYLHPSPLSQRISSHFAKSLQVRPPAFPSDIGAALLGLALQKENEERAHLGKPYETGSSPPHQWVPPATLLRRLYRIRHPFESYQEPA